MANELAKLQRSPKEVARWQKAQQQLVANRHAQALASYRDLVRRFPGVAQLWFELGLAAMGELEFNLAAEALDRAHHLATADASFQVLLGQQFHRLRRPERARACFERAVQADPSSVQARLTLAAWYERERRMEEAFRTVEECLITHAGDPQARCVKALLLHRLKRHTEAEGLLRELVRCESQDLNVKISSRHLLAQVLDQLGQHKEAMQWLVESKQVLRATADVAKMERDYDQGDQHRRQLLAALTPDTLRRWKAEPPPAPLSHGLVLLGGHPRSGTTLLEQVLGAHPQLLAIDESEAFVQEVWQHLEPMPSPRALQVNELDTLTPEQRLRIRERYQKSLLREVPSQVSGRVLVDKNPSPTAALPLWLRIFPELRVVIALRDPRDVVISCFFQNLMLTPGNANFLSLERTVRHYANLMDVWLRVRQLGGFEWIETRYEDLVTDPEAEGRRVTEFCGVSWDSRQGSPEEAARARVLFAPTFSDVAQPVHRRAVGRWQNYADALAPMLPELAVYCQAFGYPTT